MQESAPARLLKVLQLAPFVRACVPCRAVPCRAVPRRAVPCRAVPRRAVPRRAMPCVSARVSVRAPFITQQVVNWSFTDQLIRLDVPFGVSYDSDPHEVRKLAVEAAAKVDRVKDNPRAVCHLVAFGDSSLDFVLRFWVSDPQNGLTNVRGAVLLACWDAFKAAGIGIPFPHREIIMRTPVEVAGQQEPPAAPA